MPITIRKAERQDLEPLGRLGAMLIETHYAFDPQRFMAAPQGAEIGYASFLGGALDSTDSCVFVAEQDRSIVGYVYAALEPMSWKELRAAAGFIHDVAVIEKARRQGIGTQLMQASFEWLRERGAPRVILWTASANQMAQALFRRLGFRDTMIEMTMELEK